MLVEQFPARDFADSSVLLKFHKTFPKFMGVIFFACRFARYSCRVFRDASGCTNEEPSRPSIGCWRGGETVLAVY